MAMAETSKLTFYEIQPHYVGGVGVAGWARGSWSGRYLDRQAAEAQAESSRGWLIEGVQDDVRVTEVTIEVVGPLAPVTVTAPDVYVLSHAVDGTAKGMAAKGFICVDHKEVDDRSTTLTFAKAKE